MSFAAQWTDVDQDQVVDRLGLNKTLPQRLWHVAGSATPAGHADSPACGVQEGWDWLCGVLRDPYNAARHWFGAAIAATVRVVHLASSSTNV